MATVIFNEVEPKTLEFDFFKSSIIDAIDKKEDFFDKKNDKIVRTNLPNENMIKPGLKNGLLGTFKIMGF